MRFHLPDPLLDEIAHACWARRPGVWTTPSPAPYATPDDVLATLRGLYAQLDDGETFVVPRVYVDGRPTGFRLDPHLPAEGESFPEWEARLRDGARGRELGMVVPEAQMFGGPLWDHALRVARAVHARRGMPAGGAHSEIFLGNYRTSFFRLHKDSLETITFVVRGRKRFLVWPFEAFAEHAPEGAERTQVNLGADVDWQSRRDEATVLEGGSGDVFFWPASYWHVAEAVDDDFVTTVTLAFFDSVSRAAGCPLRLAHDGVARYALDGYDSADAPYPDPAAGALAVVDSVDAALARLLADPTAIRARREHSLAWVTACGFRRVPEEGTAPDLDDDDVIEVDPANPLRWADVHDDGFPTSVNGLIVTATPKFLPLATHLNQGGRFRVGDLVAVFGTGGDAPDEQELRDALGALGAVRLFRVVNR